MNYGIDYDYEDTPQFEEEQRLLRESIREEIERRFENGE